MAKIFCVEGMDLAGKTTLVRAVTQALEAKGKSVLVINHPNRDAKTGRDAIAAANTYGVGSRAGADAFCKDFMNTINRPDLHDYDYIIYDRFIASCVVMQKNQGEVAVNARGMWKNPNMPDLSLFLDITYDVALKRSKKRSEANSAKYDSVHLKECLENPSSWELFRQRWLRGYEHSRQAVGNRRFVRLRNAEINDVLVKHLIACIDAVPESAPVKVAMGDTVVTQKQSASLPEAKSVDENKVSVVLTPVKPKVEALRAKYYNAKKV